LSASDPFAAALRLLARQGRTAAELCRKLGEKGYNEEQIAATVARCRDLGYIDDRRYAHERAGALLRSGRAAGCRIEIDLRRRGIDSEVVAAALTATAAEVDAGAVLRAQLLRRFPDFVFAAAPPKEKRRVVDFFLRRGFPYPLVLTILSEER
jgi:regulatory protein